MKHPIRDMSQIIIAVLVTTSMVVANAQKPDKAVPNPAAVHQVKVSKPAVVATVPRPTQPMPEPAPAPKPVVAPTPVPAPVVAASVAPQPKTPTTHQELMAAAGIAPGDYGAVDYIVSHESGWCSTKWEGEIGYCPAYHGVSSYDGYGLCQSTPPQKMALAGGDWATNPVTQLKWCSLYAIERYGSWWTAYNHWIANHNW